MMKDTGIIRRIDDLGRVVIPRELRRQIKIEEGDPLIYSIDTKTNAIEIKKYNPASQRRETVEQKAAEWLVEYDVTSNTMVSFSINYKTAVCAFVDRTGKIHIGKATCSPNDTFSPYIGMVISYCRAKGKNVPDFIKL